MSSSTYKVATKKKSASKRSVANKQEYSEEDKAYMRMNKRMNKLFHRTLSSNLSSMEEYREFISTKIKVAKTQRFHGCNFGETVTKNFDKHLEEIVKCDHNTIDAIKFLLEKLEVFLEDAYNPLYTRTEHLSTTIYPKTFDLKAKFISLLDATNSSIQVIEKVLGVSK